MNIFDELFQDRIEEEDTDKKEITPVHSAPLQQQQQQQKRNPRFHWIVDKTQFDFGSIGYVSCGAISLMSIYSYVKYHPERIESLNWIDILSDGCDLWNYWQTLKKDDPDAAQYSMQTVNELFEIPRVSPIRKRLSIENEIQGYLVITKREEEILESMSSEDSFCVSFETAITDFIQRGDSTIHISITIGGGTFALISHIDKENGNERQFWLFDSHDSEKYKGYSTLVTFYDDKESIITYLINRAKRQNKHLFADKIGLLYQQGETYDNNPNLWGNIFTMCFLKARNI